MLPRSTEYYTASVANLKGWFLSDSLRSRIANGINRMQYLRDEGGTASVLEISNSFIDIPRQIGLNQSKSGN
jgi:hypothetical protein